MSRKKEGNEIQVPPLPRSAADIQSWFNAVSDAVTACACDPDTSFEWIACVEDDNASFIDLGITAPEFASLDAKLRAALSKHTTGDSVQGKELVNVILGKAEELKRAMPRRQIKGRQILLLIRRFFEVKQDRRIQYELSNLLDLSYPGDKKLAQFKYAWDNMLRNMRCPIMQTEPKTIEHLLYRLVKNSDTLRPYVEYYNRLHEDHADRSYRFLSQMIDKTVQEERQRRNQEALVISASGGTKALPSAPGVPRCDESPDGMEPKGKGKGKGKGKTNGQNKGKGKGKHRGSSPDASNADSRGDGGSDACSDADGAREKGDQIHRAERCCYYHFWGKC